MTKKLCALLLGLSLTIAGCTQQHSPEDSIQTFYESLSSQNYPELLSLFDLESNLQGRQSESELYEILATIFKDVATSKRKVGFIKLNITPLNIIPIKTAQLSDIHSISMTAAIPLTRSF